MEEQRTARPSCGDPGLILAVAPVWWHRARDPGDRRPDPDALRPVHEERMGRLVHHLSGEQEPRLGHGLVFTPGERVHSFTSPIGTLIPALLAYVTGCTNDDLVLWLYRAISSLVLGATGVLLFRVARALGRASRDHRPDRLARRRPEDGRLLDQRDGDRLPGLLRRPDRLFPGRGQQLAALRSGSRGAGSCGRRPDGFIYGGAVAAGFLLFPRAVAGGVGRVEVLRRYALAAAVTALIYARGPSGRGPITGRPSRTRSSRRDSTGKGRSSGRGSCSIRLVVSGARRRSSPRTTTWADGCGSRMPTDSSRSCALPGCPGRTSVRAGRLGRLPPLARLPPRRRAFAFPWYWPAATILAVFVLAEVTEQLAEGGRPSSRAGPTRP